MNYVYHTTSTATKIQRALLSTVITFALIGSVVSGMTRSAVNLPSGLAAAQHAHTHHLQG